MLSMSLDSALETFSFRDCRCVDLIANCKYICLNLASKCIFLCAFQLKLSDKPFAGNSCLVKVALHSFANTMSVDNLFFSTLVLVDNSVLLINKTNLYCTVTVIFHCLNLCYHTRPSLKHGYRNQCSILAKNLCHSDFGS